MTKRVNILGNGDSAGMFKRGTSGKLLVCNMPPFEITRNEVHATCMVDFKMMKALTNGDFPNPYTWVLGYRPKVWMEKNPSFYMQNSSKIKEFYTELPAYAGKGGQGYTNFNCGHFATHWTANKVGAEEIHMYGFDSIMDFDIRSKTDFLLPSDRGSMNTQRLSHTWRTIFKGIFEEFKDTQFVIHHKHDNIKFPKPDNVDIVVHKNA